MKKDIEEFWEAFHKAVTNKKNEDAIKILEQILKIEPENRDASINLGALLAAAGKVELAIEKLQPILDAEPFDTIALLNLGYCYLEKGDFEKSILNNDTVISFSKRNGVDNYTLSYAYANIGKALEKQAYFEEAIDYYKYALQLFPENKTAFRSLEILKDTEENGILRRVQKDDGSSRIEVWSYREDVVQPPRLNLNLSMQAALIDSNKNTPEGKIVSAVLIPWIEILREIAKDPNFLFKIPWRKLEELVAGSYTKAGWDEVILTPGSGDFGRDIIATKRGLCTIRIFDQIKAYSPTYKVSASDIRALLGTLQVTQNVSKAILSTSSSFAPGVFDEFRNLMPYRLQLRDGLQLRQDMMLNSGFKLSDLLQYAPIHNV